jgi:hypothetical protein
MPRHSSAHERDQVAVHFNLRTGGYSVHEPGRGTVETDTPIVLLHGAYGRVHRSGHQKYLQSLSDPDAVVTIDRRWDLRRDERGRFVCVPSGPLDPPMRAPMGKRNLYAWSVGKRASDAETMAAYEAAMTGSGGWQLGGFDAKRGVFAELAIRDGRPVFGEPLPSDGSVDVLLTSEPNMIPGTTPPRCRPLYRPAGKPVLDRDGNQVFNERGEPQIRWTWTTPPGTRPGMFWRPAAARSNPRRRRR